MILRGMVGRSLLRRFSRNESDILELDALHHSPTIPCSLTDRHVASHVGYLRSGCA